MPKIQYLNSELQNIQTYSYLSEQISSAGTFIGSLDLPPDFTRA